MQELIFHPTKIEFKNYGIFAASVIKEPFLDIEHISEIRLNRWPPEVVTKKGEVLFVPTYYKKHLDLFARVNHLPIIEREDVWALLCEPFLDTEFDEADKQKTIQRLNESGFSTEEIKAIRKKIALRVGAYNFRLWEWMHLGHADVLTAFGMEARFPILGKARAIKRYNEFNSVSNRGKVIQPIVFSIEEKAKNRISDLVYDILPVSVTGIAKSLLNDTDKRQELADRILKLIISHYGNPSRAYHNVEHVLNVVEYCKSLCVPETKERHISLQLAAWFHDIIYDSSSTQNEEDSVELMRNVLKDYVSEADLETATALILMTKKHFNAATKYEKVLSDADLSILAEEESIYTEYKNAIRAEYSHLDEKSYKLGRTQFISTLLSHIESQGHFYHYLHPLHEDQALKNLRNELRGLSLAS